MNNKKREYDEMGHPKCKWCNALFLEEDDLAQHESAQHGSDLKEFTLDEHTNDFRLNETLAFLEKGPNSKGKV